MQKGGEGWVRRAAVCEDVEEPEENRKTVLTY